MNWDDAIEEARNYPNTDWKDIIHNAKKILSEEMKRTSRTAHWVYLKSDEWKIKSERVLKMDNYICQDCLRLTPKIIKENFSKFDLSGIEIFRRATEVHHLDYIFKQTPQEEEYCISLCGYCHSIRHSNLWYDVEKIMQKREMEIIQKIYLQLLKQPEYLKLKQKQKDSFIKSPTRKPNIFLNEVKNGESDN